MSSFIDCTHSPRRQHEPQRRNHLGRRRVVCLRWWGWVVIALLLVAAVPTLVHVFASESARATERPSHNPLAYDHGASPQPADRFMQSIMTDDGASGWRQLCPNIQAQLPLDTVIQQANAQRIAMAQQGVRLTMTIVGAYPQRGGGASHVYAVTAHWPGGTTRTRTFIVLTLPSGCVEDVHNS